MGTVDIWFCCTFFAGEFWGGLRGDPHLRVGGDIHQGRYCAFKSAGSFGWCDFLCRVMPVVVIVGVEMEE